MKGLIIFTLWTVSVAIGILVVANGYGEYRCSNYQEVTGVETTFKRFDACYFKGDNGRFERQGNTTSNN